MCSDLNCITDWDGLFQKARFRVKGVARRCNVSTRWLEYFFLHKFGTQLRVRMRERRVQLAKELLASGELAKNVAKVVGFTHASSFSRWFKKAVGSSPKMLRRPNGKSVGRTSH